MMTKTLKDLYMYFLYLHNTEIVRQRKIDGDKVMISVYNDYEDIFEEFLLEPRDD